MYCSQLYKYNYNICDVSENRIIKNLLAKYIKTDVITLYALENNVKKKIGIAHIPTIKCSNLCNKYIPRNDYIKIKCKLNTNFKKWEPLEIIMDSKDNIADYNDVISNIRNIVSEY